MADGNAYASLFVKLFNATDKESDMIVGPEARGFIVLGCQIAFELGIGLLW